MLLRSIGSTPSTPPQSATSSLKSPNSGAVFTFTPTKNKILSSKQKQDKSSSKKARDEHMNTTPVTASVKHEESKQPIGVTKYHGFIRKLEKSSMTSEELKEKLKKHQRKLAPGEIKRLRALISHRLQTEEDELKHNIETLQLKVKAKEAAVEIDSKSFEDALLEKPQALQTPPALVVATPKEEDDNGFPNQPDEIKFTTLSSSNAVKLETTAGDDYLGVLSPGSENGNLTKKLKKAPLAFTPRGIVVKSLAAASPPPKVDVSPSSVESKKIHFIATSKDDENCTASVAKRLPKSKALTSSPSILDLLPPPPPPPPLLSSSAKKAPSTYPVVVKRRPTSPLVSPTSQQLDAKRLSLSEYHKRKPKGSDSMIESEYLAFLQSIGDEPSPDIGYDKKTVKNEPRKVDSPSVSPLAKPELKISFPPIDPRRKSLTSTTSPLQSHPTPTFISKRPPSPKSLLRVPSSRFIVDPAANPKKSILVTPSSISPATTLQKQDKTDSVVLKKQSIEESPSKTARNILSLLGPGWNSSVKKNLSSSSQEISQSEANKSSPSTSLTDNNTNINKSNVIEKKKGYLCGECNQSFVSFVDLEIHVNEKHTNIETINKIDVNPHNSIRVSKPAQHNIKKVTTAAPTVQFTKIKKTPGVVENPDKVKVHYSSSTKKSNNSSTTSKQITPKSSQKPVSNGKTKKLSNADIKQELARIKELREKERSTPEEAVKNKTNKSSSAHQNGESPKKQQQNETEKDKKLKSLSKEELRERERLVNQKRLKKKKRKEKERALQLKQMMDVKMKEQRVIADKEKKLKKSADTNKKESSTSTVEKRQNDNGEAPTEATQVLRETSASHISVSEDAELAATENDTTTSGGDNTTVVGKRQSKQTQRKKAFMEALKARQSRRKQMQEFVIDDNSETGSSTSTQASATTAATATSSSAKIKLSSAKTSGMIKAKEVIMKSKKVKRDLHQQQQSEQQQLSEKQEQKEESLVAKQPKRVALHQKVESVFKVGNSNSKNSNNTLSTKSTTEILVANNKETAENTEEISFKNTILCEEALETIFNRVKSQKEHMKANNQQQQQQHQEHSMTTSKVSPPQSSSVPLRKASLSEDDDPKVRALKKQIGKAERAVRVLIRNQRKKDGGTGSEDTTMPSGEVNSGDGHHHPKSRRNSTDGDIATAASPGAGGGPLKVKLHIKMADFHSEATALMSSPSSSVAGKLTGNGGEVDALDGNKETEVNDQQTNNKQGKRNKGGANNNRNKRRKGALTSRKRKAKDDNDNSVTTTATDQQIGQGKASSSTPSTPSTKVRRKRSKYYVYEDELYAAQHLKPLYGAVADTPSVEARLTPSASDLTLSDLSPPADAVSVDFTMISSEVDFDSEFDYASLQPGGQLFLTADDLMSSLQSLSIDALSIEAAQQMEMAREEQLSKVCLFIFSGLS